MFLRSLDRCVPSTVDGALLMFPPRALMQRISVDLPEPEGPQMSDALAPVHRQVDVAQNVEGAEPFVHAGDLRSRSRRRPSTATGRLRGRPRGLPAPQPWSCSFPAMIGDARRTPDGGRAMVTAIAPNNKHMAGVRRQSGRRRFETAEKIVVRRPGNGRVGRSAERRGEEQEPAVGPLRDSGPRARPTGVDSPMLPSKHLAVIADRRNGMHGPVIGATPAWPRETLRFPGAVDLAVGGRPPRQGP